MNINATGSVRQVRLKDVEMMNKNKFTQIVLNLFTKQNILIYFLAFMLSTVNGAGDNMFFGLSIFAAICSNSIPIGMVYLTTIIGTGIGFGREGLLMYMITSLVFIVLTLLNRPKYIDENRNEKQKLGFLLFISVLIVGIGKMIFTYFLLYDLLATITIATETYIFYKIFVNAVAVLDEINLKNVFSIEETMGVTITIAIAITAINSFTLLGIEVKSVLSILLVLIMGWKNGMLVGATSGITVGTVLGIITGVNPIIIAIYGVSGLVSGFLNKFGKIGVAIGFIIGNTILTFVISGNAVEFIYLKEILVASLGLLLIPKGIQINIKELVHDEPCLPVGANYRIDGDSEVKEKIDNISKTIKNISELYSEKEVDSIKKNKEEFLARLKINLEDKKENIISENILDIGNLAMNDIFEILQNEDIIEKNSIINIFNKYNAYVLGLEGDNANKEVLDNLNEVIEVINSTYKVYKSDFIANKKIKETKKNISNQLENVSKVLANMMDELYEQNEFEKEIIEIRNIANKKGLTLVNIEIKKETTNRIIVNLYIKSEKNKKKNTTSVLERIVTDVFNEKMEIQKKQDTLEDSEITKYIFASEDKYNIQLGSAKTVKDGNKTSGDSKIHHKLNDGKFFIVLSDGMGAGAKAKKASSIATKMLDRLLNNGFERESAIKLINSTISSKEIDSTFTTLDIAIVDLYKGNIEFVKNGACPTYIKTKNGVELLNVASLPAGIVDKIELEVYDKDLQDGDIIVMCTDGVMDSKEEYQDKELWIREFLEKIETTDAQKIADLILAEAVDNNYGKPKDDMTVICARITKK